MSVIHQGEYAGLSQAAHLPSGRRLNPLVKIAFADENLAFDFKDVRIEFAKGALRKFEPAGEEL